MKRTPPGRSTSPGLETLEVRQLLAGWSATGAAPGGPPEVRIYDANGIEQTRFLAFDASFRGGVQVALGDLNGDGRAEVIAAAGPGRARDVGGVRVFDGGTGRPLAGPLGAFQPFARNGRHGVSVATADVNSDGFSDIIAGAGPGRAPQVKVYSGADGSLLSSFLAFHSSFRGGVRVAAGTFREGHGADIVVVTGPGSLPLVKIIEPGTRDVLARYLPFAASFRGGVHVASGDLDADGLADVVVGQGPGGRSRVRAFSGLSNRVIVDHLADVGSSRTGVQVSTGDADGDGKSDLYIAGRSSRSIPVRVLDGRTLEPVHGFRAVTDTASPGGVSVAGIARPAVGSEYCDYNFENTILPEYPLLERLAFFDPNETDPTKQFKPVTGHSLTNSPTTAKNVYVIAHGWMPGYLDWVNSIQTTSGNPLPTSWETWQTNSGLSPSTPWLFQEVQTTSPVFDATTTGLAQQILAVDPNATVLAYSWIDDSATCENWAGIPEDVFHSEAYTTMNGLRMAQALTQVLDPTYSQGLGRVHLLGHSHGARVATVAALALQQAAAQDASLDVVRQLTLLDSPEDNDADISDNNPIDIDAANFAWFLLAQLDIARTVVFTGTTTAGQSTVSGLNTTNLVVGMGVSGAGIPTGTTVASIDPNGPQVTLSAPATASGSTSITFTPPPRSLFVDSYVSYYGAAYNNFVVDSPDQGIHNQALTNVVDVNLNPLPFSSFDSNVISLEHEYAAAWYAGSQYTQSLPASQQVGLFWSPLLANAQTNLPASSGQTWTDSNLGESTQFIIAPQSSPATVQPVFSAIPLKHEHLTGDVTTTTDNSGVTAVQLSNDQGPATFRGTLAKKDDSVVGFSFDYDFSQVGDGSQLQIWLNDALYFAMTGAVAKSSALPGSGKLSSTFGLGYESTGVQTIEIRLIPGASSNGSGSTSVTVDNFHVFTME